MNPNNTSNKCSSPDSRLLSISSLNQTNTHKRPSTATRAFTAFVLKRPNDLLRRPSTSGHMDSTHRQIYTMHRTPPLTINETASPRIDYSDDDYYFSFMPTPSRSNYMPPSAPRQIKRKWNLFRLTELAGIMGILPETSVKSQSMPKEAIPVSHKIDLEKTTVFLDDDTIEQSLPSPRLRTVYKELNGFPTGMVSACDTSFSKVGGVAPSIISNEDANSHNSSRGTLQPIVKIRPEYDTIYKKKQVDGKDSQNVVCVISVQMPSRRSTGEEDLRVSENDWRVRARSGRVISVESHAEVDHFEGTEEGVFEARQNLKNSQQTRKNSLGNTDFSKDGRRDDDEVEAFSFSATPSALPTEPMNPFANIVDDLRTRVADWKGHTVDRFGPLLMYDFLGVQQDSAVREFYVYLFREALLCVAEERKKEKDLARLTGSDRAIQYKTQEKGGQSSTQEAAVVTSGSELRRTALKLKGRIWLRHIRRCEENDDSPDVHNLSIKLEDESLDQFVLCFKDKGLRSVWRERLTNLLEEQRRIFRGSKKHSMRDVPLPPIPQEGNRIQEDGSLLGNGKRCDTDASTSGHSTYSGKAAGNYGLALSPRFQPPSPIGLAPVSPDASSMRTSKSGENLTGPVCGYSSTDFARYKRDSAHSKNSYLQQWSASGGLDPTLPAPDLLPHTPIDLVIIVSVPSQVIVRPSTTLCTTAAIKLQLLRSMLEFVVAHMGSGDRLALMAYSGGIEGTVRRTSLLSTFKIASRDALDNFIDSLGKPWKGPGKDPYLEDVSRLGGNGDRIDTVTAVNIGFDSILQRKSKNPVTSMILVTDVSEPPRRGQMDLVLARSEAASVPVHCFGFGKNHDPSSLWLLSNHTRGSYTFIKEWCQLKECITGCIGSIMSLALTQVKVHVFVPSDNHFRIRKVAGSTGAIISSDGKNVDLELGDIRYGDCKELFVELELDITALLYQYNADNKGNDATESNRRKIVSDHYERGSATDDFVQQLGLQSLNLTPSMNMELPTPSDSFDHSIFESKFIEEVAVLQVDCGYRNVNTGVQIVRLANPSVLTLEIDTTTPDPLGELQHAGLATASADPVVTRRRLEIFVSDMISRCLLLVSRKNQSQALTLLIETKRIVETVLQAISNQIERPTPSIPIHSEGRKIITPRASQGRRQKEKEILHGMTVYSLTAMLDDLEILIDGLESNRQISFDRIERNFGAQQAMALRDQRAWTSRTNTEWQFFKKIDNAAPFAALAASLAHHERT